MLESTYEEDTKRYHIVKSAISLFLVLLFVFMTPFRIFAEESKRVYVSEVRYCQKSTADEAKTWLKDNGYIVLDKNLNEGGRGGVVYMGYKTTTNKNDAITDIAYMEENGGYELMDYRTYIDRNAGRYSDIANEMVTAGVELKNKISNGNKAAQAALKTLNYLVIDEDDTKADSSLTGFGDWLINTNINDAEKRNQIINILVLCNSSVVNFIYSQLSFGTACYEGESWLKNLSEIGQSVQPEYTADRYGYVESAAQLVPALQGFAASYRAMERRKSENDGEIKLSKDMADLKSASESEALKIEERGISNQQNCLTVAEGEKQVTTPTAETEKNSNLEQADVCDADLITDALYKSLSEIPFEDGNVADYLIELGERQVKTSDMTQAFPYYRDIFPLVKVLSSGQFAAVHLHGFAEAITADLSHSGETVEHAIEKINKDGKDLIEANNGHRLSIWYDVDKELYQGKVGVTSQQKRRNAAAGCTTLRERNDTQKNRDYLNSTLQKLEVACSAAGFLAVCVSVGLSIAEVSTSSITIISGALGFSASTGVSTSVTVSAFFSVGFTVVTIALIVSIIIISIIMAVMESSDDKAYNNPNHEDIPFLMYDLLTRDSKDYTIKYMACRNQDGKAADLNAGNCKYWCAPYYTKSPDAGDPIVVPDNNEVFKIQVSDSSTPNGYKPNRFFEENVAGNTNRGTFDETTNPAIFVFSYTGTTYKNTETKTGDGEYISDLRVFSGDNYTVEKARAEAYDSGFTLIEVNLTPEDGKKVNFLGYKTSKSTEKVVRDIRVGPGIKSTDFSYGKAGYGNAGMISDSVGLFYSSDKDLGAPIRKENLRIFKSHDEAPEGFEPVNTFSGGDAFNLASSSRNTGRFVSVNSSKNMALKSIGEWNSENSRFLYFKPEETYTRENSVKYLSGFVYLSVAENTSDSTVDHYLDSLAKELNVNIIKDSESDYKLSDTQTYSKSRLNRNKTVLAYSTTYNPKRAVYDVKYYEMDQNARLCLPSVSCNGATYSVCENEHNMQRLEFNEFTGSYYDTTGNRTRYYSPYHGINIETSNSDENFQYGTKKIANRSLYVTGLTSGGTPIKESDFKFSNKDKIPDGMVSVKNICDYGQRDVINIAHEYNETPLYLYLKGKEIEKKEFIASIRVGYSDSNQNGLARDIAKTSAAAPVGAETLPYNLCNKEGGKDEPNGDQAAYIGVTRTDDQMQAVSNIKLVKEEKCLIFDSDANKNTPANSLVIDGKSYSLAEGMKESGPIKGGGLVGSNFYIYYCIGPSKGAPIANLIVTGRVIEEGFTTVGLNDGSLELDRGVYLHANERVDGKVPMYISDINVFGGDTLYDATNKAAVAGYPYVIVNNLNPGQRFEWENWIQSWYTELLSDTEIENFGLDMDKRNEEYHHWQDKYLVLAYRRTSYIEFAIRNIYATYDEPKMKTGKADFENYKYTAFKAGQRTVVQGLVPYTLIDTDINTRRLGTEQIYLYYTTHNEGKRYETVDGREQAVFDYGGEERAPITNIAVHNVGSAYKGTKNVHYVCNARTHEKQDINQGSILIDSDHNFHDSRCYIIFSRSNDKEQIGSENFNLFVNDEVVATKSDSGSAGISFGSNEGNKSYFDDLFGVYFSKLLFKQVYDGGGGDFGDDDGYDAGGGDFGDDDNNGGWYNGVIVTWYDDDDGNDGDDGDDDRPWWKPVYDGGGGGF